MLLEKEIEINYKRVQGRIKCAQKESGSTKKVRLLAVSKKQSLKKLKALYLCGHRDFAENYCQELEQKQKGLKEEGCEQISWSFIGRLQSNKIKKIVSLCSEIQSLESLKHARLIEKGAKEIGKAPFPIYVLVNACEEPTKGGLPLAEVEAFMEGLKELRGLFVKGLMVLPPKVDLEKKDLSFYKGLYRALEKKAKGFGEGELSLGMSSDLELAVSSGSSCVRVGTDLFGKREVQE